MATSFDTEKFIRCVHLRPVLWDLSCQDYLNKFKKQDAWLEVCKEMFEDFDNFSDTKKKDIGQSIQKKWKNLRNCFSRELRLRKSTKSGSGAGHKEYIYFEMLQFLKGNITNITCSSSDNINEDDVDNPKEEMEIKTPVCKKKKDDTSSNVQMRCNYLQSSIENITAAQNAPEDEDRMFMLSLVKDMKKIPEHLKLLAKGDIIRVINNYTRQNSFNFTNILPEGVQFHPVNPISSNSVFPTNVLYAVQSDYPNLHYYRSPNSYSTPGPSTSQSFPQETRNPKLPHSVPPSCPSTPSDTSSILDLI